MDWSDQVVEALQYAWNVGESSGLTFVRLLDELNPIAQSLWNKLSWPTTNVPGRRHSRDIDGLWFKSVAFNGNDYHDWPDSWHSTYLCFAINLGLLPYVAETLKSDPNLVMTHTGRPLLHYTIDNRSHWVDQPQPGMVNLLLKNGAQAEECFEVLNSWQIAVNSAFETFALKLPEPKSQCLSLQVLEHLLDHGANPGVHIQDLDMPGYANLFCKAGNALQMLTFLYQMLSIPTCNINPEPSEIPTLKLLRPLIERVRLQTTMNQCATFSGADSQEIWGILPRNKGWVLVGEDWPPKRNAVRKTSDM